MLINIFKMEVSDSGIVNADFTGLGGVPIESHDRWHCE